MRVPVPGKGRSQNVLVPVSHVMTSHFELLKDFPVSAIGDSKDGDGAYSVFEFPDKMTTRTVVTFEPRR